MSINEYQELAVRTASKHPLNPDLNLAIMALGLVSEAGEVGDLIKKHVGHGHDLNAELVKKEMGDVLWYLAALADVLDFSLEEVARLNIEKLRKRYPDGFSQKASRERKD